MTERVLLFILSAACCAAQHCDPQLASAVSPTDPNRYRERDDRCEGLYYRGVSGETLLETSLTEMYEDFTPDGVKSLFIEWKAPANAETSLRRQMGLHWIGLGPEGTVPIQAGARFDGKYYTSGVSHSYSHDAGRRRDAFRSRRP